jgi:hypothetical protein
MFSGCQVLVRLLNVASSVPLETRSFQAPIMLVTGTHYGIRVEIEYFYIYDLRRLSNDYVVVCVREY